MTPFTFYYRDLRRERLAKALRALENAPDEGLEAQLEDEQTLLQADGWRVSDRAYLTAAHDWLWGRMFPLATIVHGDPALKALGATSALIDERVEAVEMVPRNPALRSNYLDWVRSAAGTAGFTELVHTGHRLWLLNAEPAYLFDDVGVLLPVRLETLFDRPPEGETQWKLFLRVIPDEASILRDNPRVSDGERDSLLAFWNAVKQPPASPKEWLETDRCKAEWSTLSARVGAARAAWLVSTFEPRIEDDAVRVDIPELEQDLPNRVGGMPPRLDVWVMADETPIGAQQHRVGTLPMDENKSIDSAALELPLPQNIESAKNTWWASWEKAKEVGMGGEWLLPDGIHPKNITALYVVGIGDEPPNAHFRGQVDAGELALLRLGAPTNTVQGSPAAELAKDAGSWLRVAINRIVERADPIQTRQGWAAKNNALQLTGDINALPFYPDAESTDDTDLSSQMAKALWPALWGHFLHDLWQGEEQAHRTGLWAMRHLFPEGPLMPLRIRDQPYGLLPTTALSWWQVGSATLDDPLQRDVEHRMAHEMVVLRGILAAKAQEKGTVVGKDTRGLVDLLSRDASSRIYLWRKFLPVAIGASAYSPDPALRDAFLATTRQYYDSIEQRMGRPPADYYAATGAAVRNWMPLLKPWGMIYRATPDRQEPERVPLVKLLQALLGDRALETFYTVLDPQDRRRFVLPNSLFIRLLVYACQVGMQWRNSDDSQLTLMLIDEHQKRAQQLAEDLDREEWSVEDRNPFTRTPMFLLEIPDEVRLPMERAFRSTLDSASHRIDPWVTGFAWQRLEQHSNSPRSMHRLGVYGWVDGPFLGEPGPTEAGRLHAPSHAQALASLILRDQFLSSARQRADPSSRNPWQMDIDSRKVRVAEEIADEVRLGFNVHEIVGRRVESIIGKHQMVKNLRTNESYAMRPERKDPNEVCDGIRALKGLLKGSPDAILSVEDLRLDQPDQPPGDPLFPLSDPQRLELKLLHLSLDTYADLLMADGVMHVVNRQMDRAAETMDAAAGFSRPPTFEFIRTPPSGYQLETRVLTVLPFVAIEDVADDDSPCRIADPSIAACIEQKLGSAWQWTIVDAADPDAVLGTVGLNELGFTPPDALVLSSEFLNEAARLKRGFPLIYISEGRNRRWEAVDAAEQVIASTTLVELGLAPGALAEFTNDELNQRLRDKLGVALDVTIREGVLEEPRIWIARDEDGRLLGMATVANLEMTSAELEAAEEAMIHAKVRAFLGLVEVRVISPKEHRLARVIAAGLGSRPAAGRDLAADAAAQKLADDQVREDLVKRYKKLYAACQDTIVELADAAAAAADDATRTAALRRGLRWGITVIADPQDRAALFAALLGTAPPNGAASLSELVARAAKSLGERLKRAPAPDETPAAIDLLAREIAALCTPDGKLSVLALWTQSRLLDGTGIKTEQAEATLDDDWLTVVAPVRPPLARFEALQLEGRVLGAFAPFEAWTSSPDDPWRTRADAAVQKNFKKRKDGEPFGFDLSPFVAVYGSADAWIGETVAVGLLDAFSEAIPMRERTTMTAFGFNAPAARAPQAILLAVPPVPRQRLENDLLLQIVRETRQLAHARAAWVDNLGEWQLHTQTMWLQASGAAQVHLESWPLWA